jgi:hypothetical protein
MARLRWNAVELRTLLRAPGLRPRELEPTFEPERDRLKQPWAPRYGRPLLRALQAIANALPMFILGRFWCQRRPAPQERSPRPVDPHARRQAQHEHSLAGGRGTASTYPAGIATLGFSCSYLPPKRTVPYANDAPRPSPVQVRSFAGPRGE